MIRRHIKIVVLQMKTLIIVRDNKRIGVVGFQRTILNLILIEI
jgi:hypothetical protein